MFTITRSEYNPILSPLEKLPWEALAVFNGCPIEHNNETYLLYRAMSEPDLITKRSLSVIGKTTIHNNNHGKRVELIRPDTDFDKYGCEDPRVTKIDNTFYIFYTALGGYPFSADNIKVAVAISDDLKNIREKHLVTPFNAKAMAMFSEKVNGKYAALLTINTDIGPSEICYAEFEKIEDIWSPDYWKNWWENRSSHIIQVRRENSDQVEVGAQPVLTEKGWLITYSHIQKYGQSNQVFGIEFLLLDKNNPRKIVGRTKGAFMVPEEYYEKVGQIPNIIFPSGALLRNDVLEIYYGATDTFCAVAYSPIKPILKYLSGDFEGLERFSGNPIIAPRSGYLWEEGGTINPAAIDLDGKTHILYRATTRGNVSTIGYAATYDGFTISERSEKPIYFARERFEMNPGKNENYGCEDPRLVEINNKIYMTYTAYNGYVPRVAVSTIGKDDFIAKKWHAWSKPEVVTPSNIDNKDATIVPETIHGKYLFIHRVNENICGQYIGSLNFAKEKIEQGIDILKPRKGMWDGSKVGIAGPPIKTESGWLLLYHGVSVNRKYRVGALLLDIDDPTIVRARTAVPIFEPKALYEKNGLVPNVVFPCGLVRRNEKIYVYYGGGDSVIGVATITEKDLLEILETSKNKVYINDIRDKEVIVFDLDSTLTPSKSVILDTMIDPLTALLKKKKVAIITGSNFDRIEKQVLIKLPADEEILKNLILLPTSGTRLYIRENKSWKELYSENLSSAEKDEIKEAMKKALDLAKYKKPEKIYGEIIEDRDSQITFSAIGQSAPYELKQDWDPNNKKRDVIAKYLKELLPNYDVKIGGTTSIDVTRRGVNKSYGIMKLAEQIKIPVKEMVFVGDAIFVGGNDHSAIVTGIDCIEVKDEKETEILIRESWL